MLQLFKSAPRTIAASKAAAAPVWSTAAMSATAPAAAVSTASATPHEFFEAVAHSIENQTIARSGIGVIE